MSTEPPWTRRRFLLSAAMAAGGALLAAPSLRGAVRVPPTGALRLGLLVSGDATGASARAGVELGVEEAARTAALFGRTVELVRAPSSLGDAVAAARWLVADGNAQVLLSALPDDETARVSATADGLRIPLLNLTATRDALRGSGCHRSAFHVAPSRAMQCDAVAAWLAGTRNAKRVRMLTDAGDEGRAIAGRLARALRAHGVEVAGSTSIDKTGPGKPDVVTGPGDARPDALVFALSQTERASLLDAWRTAATNPPLVEIPMGASPDAPSPVEIFQPAAWHASLDRFGADQLNQRFQARGGRQMDDAAWAGWAAVKIAWEAAARGRADDGPGIAAYLERDTAQMDGQKGWPLSFRAWDHQLRQPMYIVSRSPAAPAGRVSGELPAGERGPSASSVSQLDALGDTAASTECRWGAA